MMFLVNDLNAAQLKALSEFANTIAAAWFTAGVIAPFFTKPRTFLETAWFLVLGLFFTVVMLQWSLLLLKGVKK